MISVVVPLLDEAESLRPFWAELRPVLEGLGGDWEVLFVDDGSTDGSAAILREFAAAEPRVRTLAFARNAGKSAAIAAAAARVRGEVVVLIDADLQADPRDVPRLLGLLGEADVVNGRRVRRDDPWPRLVASRVGNGFRNLMTNETIRDSVSPLKVVRAEFLRRVKPFQGYHRFLPTLMRLEGARVTEAPIAHRPRLHGSSKYSNLGRGRRGFFDVLAVRWMQRRRVAYEVRDEPR